MYKAIDASYNNIMMRKTYVPTRRDKLKILFEKEAFQHNVFTPFELCSEIISNVNVIDRDILVMNPEFALVLIEEFGVDPSRITIFADYDLIIETIAERMGINYIDAWRSKMKFDVSFLNPPYSRGMWRQFLRNAANSSDVVAFISPKGLGVIPTSSQHFSHRKFLIDNGIQVFENCTDSFPNVTTGDIYYGILDSSKGAIESVLETTGIAADITRKVFSCSDKLVTRLTSAPRTKDFNAIPRQDEEFEGSVKILEKAIATGPVFKYIESVNIPKEDLSKYWTTNRYFRGRELPIYEIDEVCLAGSNIALIERIDGLTLQQFKDTYFNKLFSLVLDYCNSGGFDTSCAVLNMLPRLTSPMTIDELYKLFDLTQEEIEYVEANG